MIDYNKCLNEQQKEAVTSRAQHLRIIAGAGTGKTRALTYRIAFLLSEKIILPSQLVAITFTNKVANEMKERVMNLTSEYGLPIDRMPLIATYHSFCLRFLRQEISHLQGFTKNFTISDDADQKKYLKKTASVLKIDDKSDLYAQLVNLLAAIKCQGLLPEEVSEKDIESPVIKFRQFIDFYETYQSILKKNNTMDFDDILIFSYYIIKSNPQVKQKYHNRYKAFLVDEYQDTNNLQYKLLKQFLSPEALLTVVGDPDQTIYTWRGADANLIRSTLSKDYKDLETVILNENYRSTQTILNTANDLINHNNNREKKNLIAASGIIGEDIDFRILPTQELEAKYIANQIKEDVIRNKRTYNDIAIIYRSNYLSRSIENALAQKRIPYKIYGGFRFYERASVKDALAYLRILINPEDNASTLRLLSAPTRKMGNVALANMITYAESNNLSYLETIVNHIDELNITNFSKQELEKFKSALGDILVTLNSPDYKIDNIADTIREYFTKSGFLSYISEIDKKTFEKEGKLADKELDNVNELISNISIFFNDPPQDLIEDDNDEETTLDPANLLSLFLSNVVLMSQQDEMDNTDHVSLMTVHVSKGLEFNEVYVAGLVNGIFPTSHALYDVSSEPLEEERRMFYVAMTRAKVKLHITCYRGFNYISRGENIPSMFLSEGGLLKRFASTTSMTPQNKPINIPTYNNTQSIKNRLEAFAPQEKKETSSDIFKKGLVSKNQIKNDYKVGMKVISTSYGIGTVTEVKQNKVVAIFPDKIGDNKKAIFISSAMGFKPYEENKD